MRRIILAIVMSLIVSGTAIAQDRVVVIPLSSTPKNASVSLGTTTRTNQSDKGTTYGSFLSEIAIVSCNADEVITGGTCDPSSVNMDSTTTNWGTLGRCTIVGNSLLGSSYAWTYLHDPNKYGPAITVYAVCAKKVIDAVAKISSEKTISSSIPLEEAVAKMQRQAELLKQAYESKK